MYLCQSDPGMCPPCHSEEPFLTICSTPIIALLPGLKILPAGLLKLPVNDGLGVLKIPVAFQVLMQEVGVLVKLRSPGVGEALEPVLSEANASAAASSIKSPHC